MAPPICVMKIDKDYAYCMVTFHYNIASYDGKKQYPSWCVNKYIIGTLWKDFELQVLSKPHSHNEKNQSLNVCLS